ncbi:MAG: glycosyltransferase family 1 protein [Candidatus Omnitrophota bacterium]
MVKVFYDGAIFYRQKHGGVSVVFREILKRIPKEIDIKCRCTFPSDNCPADISATVKAVVPRVRPSRFFPYIWNVANVLHCNVFKPDIFHSTFNTSVPGSRRLKTVFSVYDMIMERFPMEFSGNRWGDLVKLKERLARQADVVLCISEATKRDVITLYPGIDERKVVSVYLAADEVFSTDITVGEKGTFREQNRLERQYLLYVGSVANPYKNFDLLLNVYATSPEIHDRFDLVVVKPHGFTEHQSQIVSKLGTKIRAFSALRTPELKALYNCARVFVYPSKYEGFGIPILEAMACGVPVLTARSSSLPEVGGDAALYFDPDSSDDLRHNLLRLLDDDALRSGCLRKMVPNVERFSWDKTAHEYAAIYRRLC